MSHKKNREKPLYARNICYLRNIQGLTIKAISEKAGIKPSAWGSYEEGRAFPKWDKFKGLCEALKFHDMISLVSKDVSKQS